MSPLIEDVSQALYTLERPIQHQLKLSSNLLKKRFNIILQRESDKAELGRGHFNVRDFLLSNCIQTKCITLLSEKHQQIAVDIQIKVAFTHSMPQAMTLDGHSFSGKDLLQIEFDEEERKRLVSSESARPRTYLELLPVVQRKVDTIAKDMALKNQGLV